MEAADCTETSAVTYQTRPRRWQSTISPPWKLQIAYDFRIVWNTLRRGTAQNRRCDEITSDEVNSIINARMCL
jgi:hypothetical protein